VPAHLRCAVRFQKPDLVHVLGSGSQVVEISENDVLVKILHLLAQLGDAILELVHLAGEPVYLGGNDSKAGNRDADAHPRQREVCQAKLLELVHSLLNVANAGLDLLALHDVDAARHHRQR
jgi:hypothetical protein